MAVNNHHGSPVANAARWNIVGTLIWIAGVGCGILAVFIANSTGRYQREASIMELVWGIRVWSAFGLVGMVATIIATARREALWGLTALAFFLNGIATFYFLIWFA